MKKYRIIRTRSIEEIEKAINKIGQGRGFIIKNDNDERTLDIKNINTTQLANIVATLIKELEKKGIIGG